MDGRIDPPSLLADIAADDPRAKAEDEHLIVAHADGRLVGCANAAVRSDRLYIGKLAVAAGAGPCPALHPQCAAVRQLLM